MAWALLAVVYGGACWIGGVGVTFDVNWWNVGEKGSAQIDLEGRAVPRSHFALMGTSRKRKENRKHKRQVRNVLD